MIAKDVKAIAKDAKAIVNEAVAIADRHNHVYSLLAALRGAGNDASIVSAPPIGSASENATSKNSLDKHRFTNDSKSAPSNYDTLCNPNVMEISEIDFLVCLESKYIELCPFYKYLRENLKGALILNAEEKDYDIKIEETVKLITRWDNISNPESTSAKRFCMPGCKSQEKDGVQPILYAIMVKMVQVLGIGHHPHLTREQVISKADQRRARVIDFVVTSSAEEYLLAILPAMLGVPIEVKPVLREKNKFAQLLVEAQNQVIGHLAKRAMFSFNFGGIGEDCTVFGLELTLGSISVIVLELLGVGTADVRVTTRRSKRVPLFDEESCKQLFGEEISTMKSSFETNEEEQSGMPAGFCLLARTLASLQHVTGSSMKRSGNNCHRSFSMRSDATESIMIDRYLGCGAFSHVFELNVNAGDTQNNIPNKTYSDTPCNIHNHSYDNPLGVQESFHSVFMKVPKSHQMVKSLESEAEVLQKLTSHVCIPQLYDREAPIKAMDIKLRWERSSLLCLPLRGLIGQSANHQHSCWGSDKLKSVFNKVYGALQYAHGEGWVHLDVQPSNIITLPNPSDDDIQVSLIDWGCARNTATSLKGFIGSLPYAHDALFGMKHQCRWKPCANHDYASLAYTVATLSKGSIPWSGFSNHGALTDDIKNERLTLARDILLPYLDEWNASEEVRATLLKAMGHTAKKRKRPL
jgi:hypothetical protein